MRAPILLALVLAPTLAAAPPPAPPDIAAAIDEAARAYANVLEGLDEETLVAFLRTVVARESSFQPRLCNLLDDAASWNEPKQNGWPTADGVPHGCGLTQLTGWDHGGMPYPKNADAPPALLDKGILGKVAPPVAVTRLLDPFDPAQNLARFITEHVLPDYSLLQEAHPTWSAPELLRAVAFHWNKGDWQRYDARECAYLCLYDEYARAYGLGG